MSRKGRAKVREIIPDAKYGDKVVSKFMNALMQDGKKNVSEKIFYGALDKMKATLKLKDNEELEKFQECVEKVKPALEVRSRRVGGATYQIPMEVRPARRQALSIRWIIDSARKRKEKTMDERLFKEFLDILNDNGNALKKKADTHKMADANKAFAHYRW